MLAKLANIISRSEFIMHESFIRNFARKYAVPFYLRMNGGKIYTDKYVIFVDGRDNKGVMNFVHCMLHSNVDIESYEVDLFSALLVKHPEAIVFDIGANYGMYTLAACSLRRESDTISVLAIEPDDRVFDC